MTTVAGDHSVGGGLTRVTDLRGRAAATADPILLDPTGRRARRLRLGGRMLAAAFSMWLCALVLAGLGAFPVDLPLSGAIRAGQAPPKVPGAPDPRSSRGTASHGRTSAERRAQAASGLRQSHSSAPRSRRSNAGHRSVARTPDARTRHVATHGPRPATSTPGSRRAQPAGGGSRHSQAPVSTSGGPRGSSGASASAPGHQTGSTASSGTSASAPGHQTGSTASPGASTSAPGHQIGPGGSPPARGPGRRP
jgi:hypothetical protein